MKKPVYCFIDDSPFELKLFKDVIEARFSGILFVYASTYDECNKQLVEQKLYPSLFILDLYGREGIQKDVCIPRKELLESWIGKIPSLDAAYEGLERYNFDKNLQANEFLKQLFSILNEWRNLFSDQCASLDQGSRFGINNLQTAKNGYPSVPAVIYTRKGLFADAVILSKQNCDGIFIKPTGSTDKEIYAETEKQAECLMDSWNECIRISLSMFLLNLNTRKTAPLKLAKVLPLLNCQISTDEEEELSTLLDSLQTIAATSTPEIDTLIQWVSYYYSLP